MILNTFTKALVGAVLAIGLVSNASAATSVSCGGTYAISPGSEFFGTLSALGVPGGGSCDVQFDSTTDPLDAGALATIGPINLDQWANLTWEWFSVDAAASLTGAIAITTGENLLATMFASPNNMSQLLRFTWDQSTPGAGFDFEVSAVPLPPAVLLFGSALAGIGFLSRKRKKAEPSLV